MNTKAELVEFWRKVHLDEQLVQAFSDIPREDFVKPSLQEFAYYDQPLPTIRKQSISQPTTVMLMLQALQVKPNEKIFEVGSGVGYQACLLGRLVGEAGKVITTEVIPELVAAARQNASKCGLNQVIVLEADGSEGYPQEAPYDKIIITAACPAIPPPLIEQLKEDGIVIAPIGDLKSQTLVKGTKTKGHLELEFLGPFMFVPMKGKHGFKEVDMFYD